MNVRGTLLWGFVGTVVLSGLLSASQQMRLTRINLPYILGTMTTPDRDRAKVTGFLMHAVAGWVFAAIYAAPFESWARARRWRGPGLGVVHPLLRVVGGCFIF